MVMHMAISILLCVVSREEGAGVSPFTALNLAQLGGAQNLDIHILVCPHDLVRARGRCMQIAIEQERSHLLFWDGDVSVDDPGKVVAHMLSVEEDIVCTLYPRKNAKERTWPIVRLDIAAPRRKGHAVEIASCGMGLTLISRACMLKMAANSPTFLDKWGDIERCVPAAFMLRHVGKELLSEDYSFCYRWRELGGTVWCNAGDVADHFGAHLFEGKVEG